MSRPTVLLVDSSPALRQQLVSVLAAIPKTHLETCTSEQLAQASQQHQPQAWLLAQPQRSLSADGARQLIAQRCASLALAEAPHIPQPNTPLDGHFVLPAQAEQLGQWLRTCFAAPVLITEPSLVVAASPAMQQLLRLVERIAPSLGSVLISGETGVGKEVVARTLHRHSARALQPFVAVNCAALPDTMLEALLFGHERGAYTGAVEARPGKFQQANGGTLLLDEVTEIPLSLQAKLLRALQEREVEPLGARRPKAVDVRIVATSNRSPQLAVRDGVLRDDLYYRLSVFPLRIPPLRERTEDIVPLALQALARLSHGRLTALTESAQARLLHYAWPGNVRELLNVIERSAILGMGDPLDAQDLLFDDDWLAAPGGILPAIESSSPAVLEGELLQREQQVILDTMTALGGDRRQVAQHLGISPRTLRYKLARMREAGVKIP